VRLEKLIKKEINYRTALVVSTKKKLYFFRKTNSSRISKINSFYHSRN
jgi:hypothetical protein